MRTRPKAFGNAWPSYVTMTPGEIQTMLNEEMLAGTLKELYSDLNRVKIQPSAAEIEKMDEALRWPALYLFDDRDLALIVSDHPASAAGVSEFPPPAD